MRLVEEITIEDLRAIKKYENISDEEAKGILNGLEKLALIMYNIWLKEKKEELSHTEAISESFLRSI
ncbi:hypothetical protein BH11PAT1_BH11PAT1_7370 [soil metagenome]